MSIKDLLEEFLQEPSIGDTSSFKWHATPIGIAALCKEKEPCLANDFYADAIKEGVGVGLDLTKEETEYHPSSKGLVIIFYS